MTQATVNPWATTGGPPLLGQPGGVVALLQGAEFCVSDRSGDIVSGSPHGLFFLDTRFLSTWRLTINGASMQALDAVVAEPFAATFIQRDPPRPGHADANLVVVRRRFVGRGMREDIGIRNYGHEPVHLAVGLDIGGDFADLFEVKESRVRPRGAYAQEVRDDRFVHAVRREGVERAVHVSFSVPSQSGPHAASWEVTVPPQGAWELCAQVSYVVEGTPVQPAFRCGDPVPAPEGSRLATWRRAAPRITSDHQGLAVATAQAVEDLGVLRISDPEQPDRSIIAAGAPWFMTVFGRDSLLTAWMALLVDPQLALGVLQTLARFQGADVRADTEEEPGRILHEMRFGGAGSLALGGGSVYYGTADATPLFVMLFGELRRWGLGREIADLVPNVDRALDWIQRFGDRDDDGYVEYQRATDRGLLHQGWKDSWDGTRFADGAFAEPPIALAEVQAYTYAAYIARAHIADQEGDRSTASRFGGRAAELKQRFNRDFWLDEHGWFAMALDRDKRPVDALASNMGHCLWTGIVDEDKAEAVAARLLSSELFSGWGVRTLATSMTAYNPTSYHNGSVWPHDTAIVIAGLMRYGFVDEALRATTGLLDAATASGGRLPELFCGFPRHEVPSPVPYPTSCSPQAWSAAAPLLVTRTLLRFDPWAPRGQLWLAPVLPEGMRRLHVEGVPLADGRVTVDVQDGAVEVAGLPGGIELVREPRKPLSAYLSSSPEHARR